MRITNQMKVNASLTALNERMEQMQKLQNQLSTSRRVHRPGDDPTGTHQIMKHTSSISQNDQYQRNMDSAQAWLDQSESVIGQLEDALSRARNYAIQADSDTFSEEDRDILAAYVDALLEEVVGVANSKYMGKYIFSGTNYNEAPYHIIRDAEGQITGVEENTAGTDGDIQREIGPSQYLDINISGRELFDINDDGGIHQTLIDFRDALISNDLDGVGEVISRLDAASDHVITQRTYVGALTQRLQQAGNIAEEAEINLTDALSDVQDIDFAEVVMQYTLEENAYQAALNASSRIIQPSLLDFIA